jgi:hypothetical protein
LRPQAVDDDRQVPAPEPGLTEVVRDGADHQLHDGEVRWHDVVPEGALFLRPGDEYVDRGSHALPHLPLALGSAPGAKHHLAQSAVERLDLAHLLQGPGQPQPRVRLLHGLAQVPVDRLDHVLEQRVDQLFLICEVPVGRADAQPRVVRHVVERGGDTAVAEHLTRGGQQAPPVALGILAPRDTMGLPGHLCSPHHQKPLLRTPIMLCPR